MHIVCFVDGVCMRQMCARHGPQPGLSLGWQPSLHSCTTEMKTNVPVRGGKTQFRVLGFSFRALHTQQRMKKS